MKSMDNIMMNQPSEIKLFKYSKKLNMQHSD